jgi:tRNA threonylcarbamoyladenosine biosynthesis protein TsaE
MIKKSWTIEKEVELAEIGRFLQKEYPKNRIFLLEGDLGSGKTSFVKAFGQLIGIQDAISSPSFSLVNEYHSSEGIILYHMDLYRLESLEEALDIGIEEYIESEHIVFIEWPAVIESLVDERFSKLTFEILEDRLRKINFIQTNSDL